MEPIKRKSKENSQQRLWFLYLSGAYWVPMTFYQQKAWKDAHRHVQVFAGHCTCQPIQYLIHTFFGRVIQHDPTCLNPSWLIIKTCPTPQIEPLPSTRWAPLTEHVVGTVICTFRDCPACAGSVTGRFRRCETTASSNYGTLVLLCFTMVHCLFIQDWYMICWQYTWYPRLDIQVTTHIIYQAKCQFNYLSSTPEVPRVWFASSQCQPSVAGNTWFWVAETLKNAPQGVSWLTKS